MDHYVLELASELALGPLNLLVMSINEVLWLYLLRGCIIIVWLFLFLLAFLLSLSLFRVLVLLLIMRLMQFFWGPACLVNTLGLFLLAGVAALSLDGCGMLFTLGG